MSNIQTNKRKRESIDQDNQIRSRRAQNSANGDTDSLIFNQLQAQISDDFGASNDDSTRTAQAALATPSQNSTYPNPDSSFDASGMAQQMFGDESQTPGNLSQITSGMGLTPQTPYTNARGTGDSQSQSQTPISGKPTVGSREWHQQRKDNHKEVERRRRETINEGINEIAKIVPGCERNKGSILQRAVNYINELVANERKFANERATLDTALRELTQRMELLKKTAEQGWGEAAKWQERCRGAGLDFGDYDDGLGTGNMSNIGGLGGEIPGLEGIDGVGNVNVGVGDGTTGQ